MIGRPLPRREDGPLLTGRGAFVDDLRLPGTLHAAFLRSPVAHARVARCDAAAAAGRPGVRAAVTAARLPLPDLLTPITANAYSPPRPLLAREVVRFAGEPVAVVVAESRYAAEDALELIRVDYEPLPVVAGVERAVEESAPRLFPHPSNVLFEWTAEAGDVDGAFDRAHVVVERTFRNPRYCATPIETRGVLAAPDDGGLRVWSSTQAPHRLATLLAELLRLEPARVRVSCPDVGGGFGQKAHCHPEEIVLAWLALRLGAPVKWIEDRAENLLGACHAREQLLRVRVGADAEGRLLAMEADVSCDQGAYGVFPHGPLLEALGTPAMLPGPYRLEICRLTGRSVATNKCPEGAYRGVGLPVAAFAHERMIDILARELALDRAEVRRRNLLRPDELPHTTPTGQRYDSGDYGRALGLALDAVGYAGFEEERRRARAEGRSIGLGIASYVEYTGMNSGVFAGRGMAGIAGYDGAHVTLDAAGWATAWTTLPAIGQGVATTFAQVVAQALDLDVDHVTVAAADTAVGGLDGTGTFASRSAVAGGGALDAACAELRRRLLEDASQALEASEEDLELAGGVVRVVGAPTRGLTVGELVARAGPERYRVSARFDPPQVAYPYATHACVVEVDAETGHVRILRYAIAEDCGTVLNPLIVEGQVHGATAQGIGGTLYEAIVYDAQGQPRTASLMDYLVPTATEIPELEVRHLSIPAPGGPHGAKGVGEGGTLAPPGAIANAVSDALGVELNELPITPEAVLRALRAI